jgi:5-methylcytosine-specific restriction endonuclease McrA
MPRKYTERRGYFKAYYQANREKITAKVRAYYQADRDNIRAKKRAYYQAEKENIKAKTSAWRKANKEKHVANVVRHRALKHKRIPIKVRDCPIEKKRLRQIYKLCHIFTKATGVQHHVDHMWPISKGGPHWSGNLQIITATENLRKSTKLNKNIKATVREMLKDIKDAY